jgi:hypothetical protein
MQTEDKNELVDANPSSDSGHSPDRQRDTPLVETEGDGWDEKRIDIIGPNGNEGLHYKDGK